MGEDSKISMRPEEFLLKSFSISIDYPFNDEHLQNKCSSEFLELELNNEDSLDKARVSAISMILFLAQYGVIESFYSRYKNVILDREKIEKIIGKAVDLFDQIVEKNRGNSNLPVYVDATYFSKWKTRYQDVALTPISEPLKSSVLQVFYEQAKFADESEPAVLANDEKITDFGNEVYDKYVVGFRKLLGDDILVK
jgi:hypothetical protein